MRGLIVIHGLGWAEASLDGATVFDGPSGAGEGIHAGGATSRQAAARVGVSVSAAVKWMQRHRATGSLAPDRLGGRRPLVLAGERAWLLARIVEKPDLTLRAI